jgi:sialate O-acetylesterase
MTTPNLALTGLTRTNATIQANKPVLLRGICLPNERIQAELPSGSADSTADSQGHWRITLPPLPPGGPYTGSVSSPSARLAIENLLAGEVWLCAGQSNMAMAVGFLVPEEIPAPNPSDPLRFVHIASNVSARPLPHVEFQWQHPTLAPKLASGVACHFAQTLHDQLQTPVAFIQAAIGHTPAMSWTPRAFIHPDSTAAQRLKQFDQDLLAHPDALHNLPAYRKALQPLMAQWDKAITPWQNLARAELAAGRPMPPMPVRATGLGDTHTPTVLYNAMLAPLASEPIAGILWYQGESDAILGLADQYPQSLASLTQGLRDTFGPVPIVIVELPRHYDIQCCDPANDWPKVRWAQQSALSDPAVGVVPTLDLGDTTRIHPIQKRTLAQRAARVALALAYPNSNHTIQPPPQRHGPILHHAHFSPTTIDLTFTGVRTALTLTPSNAPNAALFEAYIQNHWRAITPTLTGPTTITLPLSAPATKVRYAWAADPLPVIFDAANLPLSPFLSSKL